MNEIEDLCEKAARFLRTAEKALELGDYDSCASRAYYAMFFVAEAALLTKRITSSSHKGLISLFGQHFVKTGIFERQLGRMLTDAYDKRLMGDYGVGLTITAKEASTLLEAARSFTRKVQRHIEGSKHKHD